MDTMNLRQRIAAMLPCFALAAFLFSPLYSLALFAVYKHLDAKNKCKMKLFYAVLLVLVIDLLVIYFGGKNVILHAAPSNILEWFFIPSPLRLCVPLVVALLYVCCGNTQADTELLQAAKRARVDNCVHTSAVDFGNRMHTFVAGTTGAGKTTLLLQYVKDSIQHEEPLYILSGKNGTDDLHSLLNMTRKLAAFYHRDMYLISLNPREVERRPYNPFASMSPGEVADALVSMSVYTEPHYKYCALIWIKAIAECLALAGVSLSLAAICNVYLWDDFAVLLGQLARNGKITKEQQREYLGLKKVADEAALSRSRFQNLLFGDGSDLFRHPEHSISASTAHKAGAIFFVDLDSFRYNDFTEAVGRLFIADMRHIIGSETNMTIHKRIILDELGAYATDQLMPIFAQARSYGYQLIAATQSIADLSAVSDTFAERLLENCGQYAVLRLNSAEDAEKMSNIIGTREVVETTHKSSGLLLDASGAGTKKIIHEYKVPPDTIKELPPLHAIVYDKQDTEHIKLLKVPFLDL